MRYASSRVQMSNKIGANTIVLTLEISVAELLICLWMSSTRIALIFQISFNKNKIQILLHMTLPHQLLYCLFIDSIDFYWKFEFE